MSREIEEKTIRGLCAEEQTGSLLLALEQTKASERVLKGIGDFKWLDERFAVSIPSTVAHTAAEIVSLLRKKGAARTV